MTHVQNPPPETELFPGFNKDPLRAPVAFADYLLREVAAGHVPVWPNTWPYARAMASGLKTLNQTQRRAVMRAVLTAPKGGPIHWDRLLDGILSQR